MGQVGAKKKKNLLCHKFSTHCAVALTHNKEVVNWSHNSSLWLPDLLTWLLYIFTYWATHTVFMCIHPYLLKDTTLMLNLAKQDAVAALTSFSVCVVHHLLLKCLHVSCTSVRLRAGWGCWWPNRMTFTHELLEERRENKEEGSGRVGQLLLGNRCKHRKRKLVALAAAGHLASHEKCARCIRSILKKYIYVRGSP